MSDSETRSLAVKTCHTLLQGKSSLAGALGGSSPAINQALLREYCAGFARWYFLLDGMLELILNKPLRRKEQAVQVALLLGLYELRFMRTPHHAVVNNWVAWAEQAGKPWAKGLLNAVLRKAQQFLETRLHAPSQWDSNVSQLHPYQRFGHPLWFWKAILKDWKKIAEKIVSANNNRAPMTLRINQRQVSRLEYKALLAELGHISTEGTLAPTALILNKAMPVELLPNFAQNWVSVQDEACQLLPLLLPPLQVGAKVLDACAAPGGKSCSLLEYYPKLELTCFDNNATRIPRLLENLERADIRANVICHDLCSGLPPGVEGDFDLIILDVPCSGTGVIRRNPDIKILRSEEDTNNLIALQAILIEQAWLALKPGGLLLYSTCSVLKKENELQILSFCSHNTDVEILSLPMLPPSPAEIGWQNFPGQSNADGFYYALLRKTIA
jgi:16S rRNA (cytosine967-C5)-methyltransferase